MGAVADAALDAGGEVIGIIPRFLEEREVAHRGVDLRIVESMHERKPLMSELSDAFVALPGGFGTFEEFFEIVTWVQLRLIDAPCIVANFDGYYDPLMRADRRRARARIHRRGEPRDRRVVFDARTGHGAAFNRSNSMNARRSDSSATAAS